MNSRHLRSIVLALACAAAQPAFAACSLSTAGLTYGGYAPGSGSASAANFSVQMTCSGSDVGQAFTLALSGGNNGSILARRQKLTGGSDLLSYNVYTSGAFSVVWGDGTAGSLVTGTTPNGTATIAIGYGSMPGGQFASPGGYTDSLTVTATWRNPGNRSTTTAVPVATQVAATCSVSTTNLAFGDYTGGSASALDATSTISVRCVTGTAYAVTLSAGTTPGASVFARAMAGPSGGKLYYNLYADSGRTSVWGDGATGTRVTGTGTGASTSLTVYGRVPPGQWPAAGVYTDLVTATVAY